MNARTDATLPWHALGQPDGHRRLRIHRIRGARPGRHGRALFERMGFRPIAKHRHKNVTLYRQGGINFIMNAEPDSFAQRFARQHGPSICAIAFRVQDAKAAYERAIALGAWGFAHTAPAPASSTSRRSRASATA